MRNSYFLPMEQRPKLVVAWVFFTIVAVTLLLRRWTTPVELSGEELRATLALERAQTRTTSGPPGVSPVYTEYTGTRVDAFGVLNEFVCEKNDPGSCDGHVCTVTQGDFNSVPWNKRQDSSNRADEFTFDEDTGLYSIPTPRWNEEVDETGELTKLNMLLYDAPDQSLCSNPLCRLGPAKDGGWSVCIDENHLKKRKCVIYSVGISTKPLFAVASAALGCEVHMFDHTLGEGERRVLSHMHKNLHFHSLGISGASDKAANLISLPDFMKANGHEFVDVLKMDCEGCEWSVFESFANSYPQLLDRVGQLLIEVHINLKLKSLDPVTSFVDHVFGKHGFRVAYRHMNPFSVNLKFHHRSLAKNQKALKEQPLVKDYALWEFVLLRQRGETSSWNKLQDGE